MTENTTEFEQACWRGIKNLEDEETDIFLLATGQPGGDIETAFSYNENSSLPKDRVVPMISTIMVCVDQQSDGSLEELISEVSQYAHQIKGEQ